MSVHFTQTERESLTVHVDNCAQRYHTLEEKLDDIKTELNREHDITHVRIDRMRISIDDLRTQLLDSRRITILSAVSVIVSLMGGIFVLLSNGPQ
jgi:hypothetical protein